MQGQEEAKGTGFPTLGDFGIIAPGMLSLGCSWRPMITAHPCVPDPTLSLD